jgi:hypothetical protein
VGSSPGLLKGCQELTAGARDSTQQHPGTDGRLEKSGILRSPHDSSSDCHPVLHSEIRLKIRVNLLDA